MQRSLAILADIALALLFTVVPLGAVTAIFLTHPENKGLTECK